MTMTEAGLKEDWLFTNALVAFVGALLMGQVWEPSEGTFKLLFFIEVPAYDGLVIFLIIAGMVVLSIVLATASVIPRLRDPVLKSRSSFATTLDLIVWVAFFLSWGSSVPELPSDQWWSLILIIAGLVFLFIIPVRVMLRVGRP